MSATHIRRFGAEDGVLKNLGGHEMQLAVIVLLLPNQL